MYELENWSEELIELFSVYIRLKQEYNQFQHMIDVSIKKVKTEEMFIKILEKFYEFYNLLFNLLDKLWKYNKEDISFLGLEDKIKLFKEEFIGYESIFNYYFKLKVALDKIKKKDYKTIHEFKKDIGIVFKLDDKEISLDIKELRVIDKKMKDFFDLLEKRLKELIKKH
ncbi:MAG TPA: hypothetical protein EYH54_05645 [Nautiliaceae bacterium]|nr:hypothetical protein [Nautiliaceae bacterium]